MSLLQWWGPNQPLVNIIFPTFQKRTKVKFLHPLVILSQRANFQFRRWDSLRRRGTFHRLYPMQRACPLRGGGRTSAGQQGQGRLRRRQRHLQWAIEAHASARHATTTSQRKDHPKSVIENAASPPRRPSLGKPCAHDGRGQQALARSNLQVGVHR